MVVPLARPEAQTMSKPFHPNQASPPRSPDNPDLLDIPALIPQRPSEETHDIPPGVHPGDVSAAYEENPVSDDAAAQQFRTGQAPWRTPNSKAIPVYQRTASDWGAQLISTGPFTNVPVKVVGRQAGRQSITMACPTHTPDGVLNTLGVVIGATEGAVQQVQTAPLASEAWTLNPGDSVTLYTEGSVWAGPFAGAANGYVQFIVAINPPSGGMSGD
jgi:hypothetical protein